MPRHLSEEAGREKNDQGPAAASSEPTAEQSSSKVSADAPASGGSPAEVAPVSAGASRGGQTSNLASVDSSGTERNTSAPEPVSAASTSPVAALSSTAVGPQAVSYASAVPTTSPSIGISLTPSLDVLSISSQFALEPVFAEAEQTKKIIVETVNEAAPVSVNKVPNAGSTISRSTNEDKADFTINLLSEAGATDPDGDVLSVKNFVVTSGDQSAFALSGNNLSVIPSTFNSLNEGGSETVTFQFDVVDPDGLSASQTGSIIFDGRNDAPTVAGPISMDIKVSNTSSGTFLIEAFDTSSSIGNLGTADTIIANNSVAASFSRSTINLSDGGQGRFSGTERFPGGLTTTFVIKATGSFSVDTAGTFTIFSRTDDGHRIEIDGTTILSDNRNHAPQEFFRPVTLTAGSHDLEVVFWENGGGAEVEIGIASGSLSSFSSSAFSLLSAAISQAIDLNLLSGVVDADKTTSLSVSNFSLSSGNNAGLTESSGTLTTNFGSLASTQNATFTFDIDDGSGGTVSQTLVVGVTPSSDGNDTVDFSSSSTAIELKAGLDDVEIINGSNFDDTLIGGSGDQTISGGTGSDKIAGGAGNDTLNGGDGDDAFQINAASDITSGGTFNGGNGDDSVVIASTSISSLVFPTSPVAFSSIETFDLSGGADGGVTVSIDGNDLSGISTFTGDGAADQLNIINGDFSFSSGQTINGIQTIKLSQSNTAQTATLNGTVAGLTTIEGTLNSSSVADDNVAISGSRDLSGATLKNIDELSLADGASSRQTIAINSNTDLGLTEIEDFTTGGGSTADIIDYKSDLVAGDGTVLSSSNDLILQSITTADKSINVISNNSTGLIEFEATQLSIDITGSTSTQITTAVEALLESTNSSTNLTGVSSQMNPGVSNSDTLLVFHEADDDAVIVRYQEGSTSEADFSGELSVVAIFDSLSHTGSNLFEDANIV